ncbi:MAG: hypothetical protein WC807_13780 [Hyphomicrobium sp.]|jgi:hypothetical protein
MRNLPKKDEFIFRIKEHLQHRDSDVVRLLWKGYLAALLEWGLLEVNDYDELKVLFSDVGKEELREIFLGFPDEDE